MQATGIGLSPVIGDKNRLEGAAPEEILIMRPQPRSRIPVKTACVQRKAALTLIAIAQSKSSSVSSSRLSRNATPALLTRIGFTRSSRPT